MFLRLQVLLYFILSVSLSFSQELPPFKNYSTSTYGAGNQNWAITQDDQGVMFFANEQGLLRFNGAQWTLFKTPNESIMRSVLSYESRIYTGCYMDFGYWEESENGNLSYTSLTKDLEDQLDPDEQFWRILSAGKYILFQSLSSIYSYNSENGNIELITREENIQKFYSVGDHYFYQVMGQGLFTIQNKKGVLVNGDELYRDNAIIEMFEYSGKDYLIFKNGDLYSFDEFSERKLTQLGGAENLTVYSAEFLKNQNQILLGTIKNGVLLCNLDGSVVFQINRENGLANNTVLSVFDSQDGNVWLGLDNGLSNVNIDSPFSRYVDQIGKLGTVYASVLYNDNLYLGTNQGLFIQKKDQTGFDLVQGTSGQVWSLNIVEKKLICHHDEGMFEIDSDRASIIFNKAGTWDSHYIPDKRMLIVGTYEGVYSLKLDDDRFSDPKKLSGFDISTKDFVINKGNVYISHEYKGVYKIDVNEDYTKVLNTEYFEGIDVDITSDIISFAGDVLFTNSNGVYLYNTKSNSFQKSEVLSGIYSQGGFSSGKTVETSDGKLWLFTKKFIFNIDRENLDGSYDITPHPLSEKVRNDKTGYENITRIADQEYLLGTTYGFLTLKTKGETQSNFRVSINNVLFRQKGNFIGVGDREDIVLSPNENNLRVYFNSTVFNALNPVLFQYKLDDNLWSDWEAKSNVLLSNLGYGEHKLEVRSKVNSVVSENTATLSFEVEKPFYLSNIAILLYAVLLAMIIYAVHYTYNLYYKRQNEREARRYKNELEVINLKNNNDLIQVRNEKLKSEMEHRSKELAVATMGTIRKNELLNEISSIADNLPDSPPAKELKKIVKKNLSSKKDWISFEEAFNNADKDFFKKIKSIHPNLTTGDLRLCVYLRLNLSSKEIAPLLHISPRSVEIKRYRLRKKMNLEKDVNLNDYIIRL
ncbi:MAG: LuxR C-terminal-related transcriptional regulator [Nonlabens sp.]